MSLSSAGQCLSENQIPSTYLKSWLKYNYFLFCKTNGIITSHRFSSWQLSAMLYLLWGNDGPPRSAFHGLNSVLKSLVRWVNSSGDSVSTAHEVMKIFLLFYMSLCYGPYTSQYFGVLAWNCLFMPPSGEFLGHLFSPWRHPSSLPLEGLFLGGNTSFEPFSVTISATVRPRRVMKKKGQHNKKVTKVLYSLIFFWGGSPTGPIQPKRCTVVDVHNVITCAKFQIEIFMGYDFTEDGIFDLPIDFSMGLTTVLCYCAACDV